METSKVKSLLEKYEAGLTSQSEEKALEAFFSRDEFPEDLAEYAAIFQWRKEQRSLAMDTMATKQFWTEFVSDNSTAAPNIKLAFTNKVFRISKFVAAASIIFMAAYWTVRQAEELNSNTKIEYAETFDDPEKAYQQTVEALAFLSTKMNSGRLKTIQCIDKLESLEIIIPD